MQKFRGATYVKEVVKNMENAIRLPSALQLRHRNNEVDV